MAAREHGRKRIRQALGDAAALGFTIRPASGHGHTWGYLTCPDCGQDMNIWSTPKNDDNHARRIAAFGRRHRKMHEEERR